MKEYLVEFTNDWDLNNSSALFKGYSFADAYWRAVEFSELYNLEMLDFYRK